MLCDMSNNSMLANGYEKVPTVLTAVCVCLLLVGEW